jgi:hypothetical protein
MADPLTDVQASWRASVARQVVYSLQRKESADEDDDRVSHFLCLGVFIAAGIPEAVPQ